jgi:hypothetical protein
MGEKDTPQSMPTQITARKRPFCELEILVIVLSAPHLCCCGKFYAEVKAEQWYFGHHFEGF